MTITLTPGQERILSEQLRDGRYLSVDEIIDHALAAFARFTRDDESRHKRMLSRSGVSLNGLVEESLE